MAKVITFSRQFQSSHPRKGEPTYFAEKVLTSFRETVHFKPNEPTHFYPDPEDLFDLNKNISYGVISDFIKQIGNYSDKFESKHHTIRQGYRWKVGDKFSPRVWSGKPYQSKQIIIAPDIEIKKIWDFSRDLISDKYYLNGHEIDADKLERIAKNDGLTIKDFKAWINKPFLGQILCWSDHIEY
jgi:hypothetical protein